MVASLYSFSPSYGDSMMNILKKDSQEAQSQAELLFALQQKKERRFRTNVAISWIILLFTLLVFFSGAKLPFGIKTISLDSNFINENIRFIASGVGVTIGISILSIILATVLALLTALGRLSSFPPVYALSTFYVSLIRGTPLFLQLFFFFLALPQLGIILPGLWAGVLALGLNYGAYMSEIFRAGLSSVGKGQREAAMALGMTSNQIMRRIILPQALRFAIPPLGNDFIAMTKDTALVSATGFVHELMWRATKVGKAYFRSMEALIIAAIFYWIMTLILTSIQSRIEARLSKGDR